MISFREAFVDLEQVKEIIKISGSIRDVLFRMNVRDSNIAYKQFRAYCEENNIIVEFHPSNRIRSKRRPLEEFLVENSNHKLNKERLIREGIFERQCSTPECSITEVWLGKKIVLELDHINGNSSDNRRENIRLLCPNCHSQTPTSNRTNRVKQIPEVYYCKCGQEKAKSSQVCKQCSPSTRIPKYRIAWPDDDELIDMLRTSNFWQVGKALGVSDNAIRKRLKARNLSW